MSIHTVCPQCETAYILRDELRGKRVRCKACQTSFVATGTPEPDEDEPEPERPRVRRKRRPESKELSMGWILGGAVAGGLILVIGVIGLVWALRPKAASETQTLTGQPAPSAPDDGTRELEEALAERDRTEPGWRMADLQRKRAVIPDSENSALVVMAAKKLLPADWPKWPVKAGAFDTERQAQERQAFEESLNNVPPNEELTEAQVAALRSELRRASAALAEARKLANMPRGRFPIEWSRGPDVLLDKLPYADARDVTRLLEYDALVRAHERDLDTALASCRAGINAGRCIDEDPMPIASLVRVACGLSTSYRIERVLNQGEASDAALAETQALVADEAE
jgi:predicted Zn finger-like uncharacterized protein